MTFGGEDLYPDFESKAAALMHSLLSNHRFIDGNKRAGAVAAEFFLNVNGIELEESDEGLTEVSLAVARGEVTAEALGIWLRRRTRRRKG